MPRILSFSPYAAWKIHTNYESTILAGCGVRGAETLTVLCDGLFAECDMYGASQSSAGRPFDLCERCQSGARDAVEATGLPYTWLSRYVGLADRRRVFEWAQGLRPDEFETATYNDFPVGWAVATSVVSYFRAPRVRLDDWHTVNVYRGFLQAAATAVLALGRLFDEWRPDALLLFNGRLSVLRVALELARARKIRCLVHEASRSQPETLVAVDGQTCISPEPFRRFWAEWGGVPLTEPECRSALRWFLERRYSEPPSGIRFAAPPGQKRALLDRLRPEPGQRILALFSTSTDEITGDPELVGPFRSQEDWIEQVVAWAAARRDCLLVVRGHPCLAGGEGLGQSREGVAWFEALGGRAPSNVRIIRPDDPLSSYDLMEVAHAGLSYGSTAGLELFATGKPVGVVPGFACYQWLSNIVRLADPAALGSDLDRLIATEPSGEFTRQALRCVFRRYVQMLLPFSLVRMTGPFTSEVRVKNVAALRPGVDAGLDRACAFLLEGAPLWPRPTAEELGRTTMSEDQLLRALAGDPGWVRHARQLGVRKNRPRKWNLAKTGRGIARMGHKLYSWLKNRPSGKKFNV